MIRNLRKLISTSITASVATRSTRVAAQKLPVTFQQKATFAYVPANKADERYLLDDEEYEIAPPRIVDNTFVYASNIIERPPLVHPTPPAWEVDYYKYLVAKDSQEAKVLPKDLADTMYGKLIEPDEYIPDPLPLVTEDDTANDRKSLYRRLDEPLYLIVKVKQEIDSKLPAEIWCFPTTEVREGENVRTAAERTVFYHVGEVKTYTLGNAPILHTVYPTVPAETKKKFPSVEKVKNFFMHSVYLNGKFEIEEGSDVVDFAWVTQPELKEYFTDDFTKPLVPLTESSLFYIKPQ